MKYTYQGDFEKFEEYSKKNGTVNSAPSQTQQGPALEADVNYIAKTYGLTPHNMPVPAEALDPRYYGDMTDIPDLQTALERVRDASEKFQSLPAKLRAHFHNSPGVMWDWLQNPDNGEEAVELGLLKKMAPEPILAPNNGIAGGTPAPSEPSA